MKLTGLSCVGLFFIVAACSPKDMGIVDLGNINPVVVKNIKKADSILLNTNLFDSTARELAFPQMIELYDNAIIADRDYLQSYTLKIDILMKSGRLIEASQTIEEALFRNPDMPILLLGQGMINEYMGHPRVASNYYKRALGFFNKKLEDDRNNEGLILNRFAATIFMKGKLETVVEIEDFSFPSKASKIAVMQFVADFNKEKFLFDRFNQY